MSRSSAIIVNLTENEARVMRFAERAYVVFSGSKRSAGAILREGGFPLVVTTLRAALDSGEWSLNTFLNANDALVDLLRESDSAEDNAEADRRDWVTAAKSHPYYCPALNRLLNPTDDDGTPIAGGVFNIWGNWIERDDNGQWSDWAPDGNTKHDRLFPLFQSMIADPALAAAAAGDTARCDAIMAALDLTISSMEPAKVRYMALDSLSARLLKSLADVTK